MSEARAESLFGMVRQSADAEAVAAMEALVRNGADRELCRVNVLDFAAKRGLDEERVIAAFLHAARVGLFELSWKRSMSRLRRGPRRNCYPEKRA